MRHFNFEPPPLILALVLGPLVEDNLRQSLILSRGSFSIFISRPICAVFLITTFFLCCAAVFRLRPSTKVRAEAE